MATKRNRKVGFWFHKAELLIYRSLWLILLVLAAAKIIKAELKGLFERPEPTIIQTGTAPAQPNVQ